MAEIAIACVAGAVGGLMGAVLSLEMMPKRLKTPLVPTMRATPAFTVVNVLMSR